MLLTVLIPKTCLQGSNMWQNFTGPCRSDMSHDAPMFQGAALAEELTGLRTEVGDFSSAVERLQRQRAEQRSELLAFQSALQVCMCLCPLSICTTTSQIYAKPHRLTAISSTSADR